MDGREVLRKMISGYPIIYGGTMMGTWFCVLIYAPSEKFGVDYFSWMFLVALLADLPLLIFYSKKKLTEKQWNIRTALHAVILAMVMLGVGYVFDFYDNLKQGLIFMGTVIGVYLMVSMIGFAGGLIEAKRINEQLRKMKE